jgi:type VI protein secretion system component VasK
VKLLDPQSLLVAITIVCLLSYQVFVTIRLTEFGGYSTGQKIAQSFIIWLVPVFGAWLVHTVIRSTERDPPGADRDFTPERSQHTD